MDKHAMRASSWRIGPAEASRGGPDLHAARHRRIAGDISGDNKFKTKGTERTLVLKYPCKEGQCTRVSFSI